MQNPTVTFVTAFIDLYEDSPTDKLEELLEYIREEAMTAMIDSGVEKD